MTKKTNIRWKRIVAWMLTLCMIFTSVQLPSIVSAASTGAEVSQSNTHNVIVPTGEGYRIAPETGYDTSVEDGGEFRFVIMIDEGYSATTAVKANGENLTAVDNIYTIEKITEDQEITIEGVTKNKCTITLPDTQMGYTINEVEDSITAVDYKGSYAFTVDLAEDYNNSTPVVAVKGGDILTQDENGIYRIANITDDIEITIADVVENEASSTDEKLMDVYLSDLTWKSATNAVGATGEDATPKKDVNHDGASIQVMVDGAAKTFTKGIGAHASSEITYDLAGKGYQRFSTYLGVDYSALSDYQNGNEGIVTAKVLIDGNEVAKAENQNPSMNALYVDVEIPENAKILSLVIESGADTYSDKVNWADAKFSMAYPDPENVALNKTVKAYKKDGTAQTVNADRNEAMVTDGIIPTTNPPSANYCDFGTDAAHETSYLQIDLGKLYEVSGINMWRYWDGRIYKGTVIEISKTADFAEKTIVYNSDKENFHELGAGTQDTYVETAAGKSIDFGDIYEARYVRIYVQGSDKGNTNHVVEVQVMGYSTEPKPYEADAFTNAETYMDIPTHFQDKDSNKNTDGSLKHIGGQVTHPDVVVLDEAWNGYKYWMVYTPNTMVTSQYENPYIAASNDGQDWVEPAGIANPIEPEPISKRYHNCDADMVYNEEMNAMMAYWNWADDQGGGVGAEIRLRISYDGIHWGVPSTYDEQTKVWTKPANESERTLKPATVDKNGIDNSFITAIASKDRYDMLSPTFTYDSNREIFVMWANNATDVGYSNGQNNKLRTSWSKDGITWSNPVNVNNFLGKNQSGQQLAPWHQDISYIPGLKEYWAFAQCFAGANPDGSVLYLTKSKDGMNWEQVGTKPILNAGENGAWDDFQIYRSTFYYDTTNAERPEDGTIRLWYSALQKNTNSAGVKVYDNQGNLLTVGSDDTRIWRVGYTENTYMNVMKALTQDEYYTQPDLVTATGLSLSVEKKSLTVGGKTNITAKFTPEDTSDQLVTYTSSAPEVAAVSPLGEITAIKDGSAIITGTTKDGVSGTVSITVGEIQKGEIRYAVSHDNPLYLENYYWSDDINTKDSWNANTNYDDENRLDSPVMLYNTIPDSLKDNTVILLIAERSLNNTTAIKEWIQRNVELCNTNKIKCAVQIANGETNVNTTIPLSFWSELAQDNEYLVGFNAAEMYNRFAGDNRDYVIDVIQIGIEHGVSMMWTDTNIFGTDGVLTDWLQRDEALANIMRKNKEYMSLMYKESYGQPNTDALYLGMWLTDYIGSWGIASDWWHWQLDGNGELFDAGSGGDAWKQCLTWPENMYTQDVLRAVSQGATGFKSEAQWYSNASKGKRLPGYQYSMIPFLEKLVSGEIKIPTKEEVAARTKAIVVGRQNWNDFNYNRTNSQLYPKTGKYGIVPFVPTNCPESALEGFDLVVTENLGAQGLQAALDKIYLEDKVTVAEGKNEAWVENFGDTWYFMNSSEDKNVTQEATMLTSIAGSQDITISAEPHAFAVLKEKANNINVYLSNYRTDKTEIWHDSKYSGGFSDQDCYNYVWELSDRMLSNTNHDKETRDTVITVKNAVEPTLEFVTQTNDGTYVEDNYVRPFTYKMEQKEGTTDEWVITVSHNGIVEFNIKTGDETVPATSVTMDKTADVYKYKTTTLVANVLPANAGNKQLTWTSSKPEVATVNAKGVVTGVGEGTTTIRAAVNDTVYAECTVTCIDLKVTSVTADPAAVSVNDGESQQVTVTLAPEVVSDNTITWSSENEEIAVVSKTGKITGLKPGTTNVIAQSAYAAKAVIPVVVNYVPDKKMDPSTMTATASSAHGGSNEGPAENVLDDNLNTWWHTGYGGEDAPVPHWITLTFDKTTLIGKYEYTPRTNVANGTVFGYKLIITDENDEEVEVANGTWAQDSTVKTVSFDPVKAKAIKLEVVSSKGGFGSAVEIRVYERVEETQPSEVDKTELNIKLMEAGTKVENTYTATTWAPFKKAYDDAKAVYDKKDATQADVNQALLTLTTKMAELVVKGNKKLLNAKITEAEAKVESAYTAETWAPFEKSLAAAIVVKNDENATQAQVDAALADLTAKINALVEVTPTPDKTELEKVVKEAKALVESKYTPESFKVMKEALAKAEVVYANAEATEKAIKEASVALRSAIDKLELAKPLNGWIQNKSNGKWKYYQNNVALKNTWKLLSGKWYYLGADEYMITNWKLIGGKWYYFNLKSGVMKIGWEKIAGKWYYMKASGAMAKGWTIVDKKWYFLDKQSGAMKTGWLKDAGKWYFLKSNGMMATGWIKVDGRWFYMDARTGVMQIKWVKLSGKWYYLKSNGAMATGWLKDGKKEYYLNRTTGAWTGATR